MFLRLLLIVSFVMIGYSPSYAQTCTGVDAGPDDTICGSQPTNLSFLYTGPKGTYLYTAGAIPYAPYPFTGGNIILSNLDDAWSPVINIPFCFEFYGTVYNQLIVGTNGLVSFDIAQANGLCPWTINVPAPNPALPLNCIMAPFHDIDPMIATPSGTTEINWQVTGTAPCRKMVISWNDIALYGNGCDTLITRSQVVLHETTFIIDVFIADKAICTTWNNGAAIECVQDASGASACVVPGRNYPSQWSASNDGVRFSPAGAPAITIQWLNPSNTVIGTTNLISVTPTQTTTYTVNATYAPCNGPPVTLTDQVTVHVIPSTLSVTSQQVPPPCNGACTGTISITVTNGQPPYSIAWTPNTLPPSFNQTGLCAGPYSCVITDASGCPLTLNFILVPPPPFTISSATTPTQCNSSTGSATVTVVGGNAPYNYTWSTGDTSSSINNLSAGTYMVTVSDTSGCSDSIPVIVQSTGLTLGVQNTTLLCNGDCNASATVTPQSGVAPFTYNWTPYGGMAATASNLCSGAFMCTVIDAQNCTTAVNVPIGSPPPLIVNASSNMTICDGESVTITAGVLGGTPPYTYSWNNSLPPQPSNVITPQQTTLYTVVVSDANGCTSPPQNTQVKVNPAPVADFYALEPECPPAMVQFINMTDTAVSYNWYFGDPQSGNLDSSTLADPVHIYGEGGAYSVTLIATNQWSCSDTLSLQAVNVPFGPVAGLSASSQVLTSLDPNSILFNNTTGGDDFCIFFGDGDSLCTTDFGPYYHTYDSIGTFEVMLVAWNQLGCTDTAWVELTIEEPTTCFVPNAFTPNGMGENNTFMVYGVNVHDFELSIFDRWGMLLFVTNDIYRGWDGTYKGNKCQEDVYVWKLTYIDNAGNLHREFGHVSLIR